MTGRRDTTARDAIQYAADAGVLPHPPPIDPSPDCTAGKHSACIGETWDTYDDCPADCPCPCHRPGGWGEP